ncbi:MAG: FAD:protein FMN transferase [Candidatus Saccharimonas sp.]
MKPLVKYTFSCIGTDWSIETETPLTKDERSTISKLIDTFEQVYSRFREDSLISVAGRSAGDYEFPVSFVELYQLYLALEHVTDGAVNPLVGRSLEQLGYDARYSLHPTGTYLPPPLSTSTQLTGTTLHTTQPLLIDIGAIGKGYLVDQVATLIAPNHTEYVVDASGDVAIRRHQPETIGLEDPRDPSRIIGVVHLTDLSLCASATNRRAWGDDLHHIIDARSGQPTDSPIIATWAVASTTVLADTLATALFFVSPDKLYSSFGNFYYATMNRDGSVTHNIEPIGELYT